MILLSYYYYYYYITLHKVSHFRTQPPSPSLSDSHQPALTLLRETTKRMEQDAMLVRRDGRRWWRRRQRKTLMACDISAPLPTIRAIRWTGCFEGVCYYMYIECTEMQGLSCKFRSLLVLAGWMGFEIVIESRRDYRWNSSGSGNLRKWMAWGWKLQILLVCEFLSYFSSYSRSIFLNCRQHSSQDDDAEKSFQISIPTFRLEIACICQNCHRLYLISSHFLYQ